MSLNKIQEFKMASPLNSISMRFDYLWDMLQCHC